MRVESPYQKVNFEKDYAPETLKEMVRMAGLCNICDQVGTRNWDKLTELIENLEKEMLGANADIEETNEIDKTFEITDRVTMEDIK